MSGRTVNSYNDVLLKKHLQITLTFLLFRELQVEGALKNYFQKSLYFTLSRDYQVEGHLKNFRCDLNRQRLSVPMGNRKYMNA